jgi:hypothetical protein
MLYIMWLSYSGAEEAQEGNIRTFQLDVMHVREQNIYQTRPKKNYVISIRQNWRHTYVNVLLYNIMNCYCSFLIPALNSELLKENNHLR